MSATIKDIESKLLATNDPVEKTDLMNDLSWELRLSDPRRGLEVATQANHLSRELSYIKATARSLCHLGVNYWYLSKFNQAVESLVNALQIFESINDSNGQAFSLNWLGNTWFSLGDYGKALQNHFKSMQLRKELDDLQGKAASLSNIGNVYAELGDYETSLEYYMQGLSAYESLQSDYGISNVLCNIGMVYNYLRDYKNALDCQLKSCQLAQKIGNRNVEISALHNIGNIYLEQNIFDEALTYYQKGIAISEELNEYYVRTNILYGIGTAYKMMGDNDNAYKYYQKSLAISMEIGCKDVELSSLLSLGRIHGNMGNTKEEYQHLQQSLIIAEELKSKPKLAECHQTLAGLFQKQGDSRKALEHFQKYHELDKELFNESSDKKRQASMIKFQVEQKEKEAEIYRLRNVELAEANQAITQAKEIIEEKNRHITSSIEYARRIQQAVLPPAGKMQTALPEHFVLFKPRDIVSGDFYWFSQTGGKILIAIVDCTGHGVPGAFMSMIGSMLLNTIVNENGETGPAKILEQLHVAVRSALKQHDAEADTTDGMDVCLCVIEQGSKQLVYAGAKRPLYLVRNKELTEIAGDGKSIGGRQKEEKRAFSDKQLALHRGDMIYLTSDGYSDQCDAEGRKIGSRRLKELLKEISGCDPSAQREALLTELGKHQGAEEQRDDIAVVGLKINLGKL